MNKFFQLLKPFRNKNSIKSYFKTQLYFSNQAETFKGLNKIFFIFNFIEYKQEIENSLKKVIFEDGKSVLVYILNH